MNEDKIIYQKRQYVTAVVIRNNGGYYQLTENETLIYGLKDDACGDDDYIIRKELTSNDYSSEKNGYILTLSTTETYLKPGVYYYDVALQRENGELVPIIPRTEIHVVKSVVL